MNTRNVIRFLFSKECEGLRVAINILMNRRFTRGDELGFRLGSRHFTIVANKLVGK